MYCFACQQTHSSAFAVRALFFPPHCFSTTCTLGVLCCFALFVCLTLLAFFLPSHLSFKNMYIYAFCCGGDGGGLVAVILGCQNFIDC